MLSMLAAGSAGIPWSLVAIGLFVALFVVLNIVEKGRWD